MTYQLLLKNSRLLLRKAALLKALMSGVRRLAYLINDEAEGYYVLYNFESAPEFPAELERIARITDGILRSLVVKK